MYLKIINKDGGKTNERCKFKKTERLHEKS